MYILTSESTGYAMIIWLVILVVFMAVFMFVPQRKQKKEKEALYNSLEIGDVIMTTGGFYGVVIDIQDDTVIVEFGSNRNCRIPMRRDAIAQIEKAGTAEES